jgi:hypothetical protein
MMRIVLLFIAIFIANVATAQITITASDMPVSGDTLRMSTASPLDTNIHLADSGASHAWNYTSLVPLSQTVDTYKTALSVSLTYFLISINAYGYKVAIPSPVARSYPYPLPSFILFLKRKQALPAT